MRVLVKLICMECGRENYHTDKKKSTPLLKFKKYCPFLRKYTIHKEKK